MVSNQNIENTNNKSPNKKKNGSSNNTSLGKINTHGLLLNKIVFSPPKDEDHYREIDSNHEVVNVRSSNNIITNQPIANTESYRKSIGNAGNDYVVVDDLENGSIVKDEEFTSDQKFAPILKMNNTGKLMFYTQLQQVQPSLVPAASITGKVQFKALAKNMDDQLSMMQEEEDLDLLSSPQHQLFGGKLPPNNNHLKRKIDVAEFDDDEAVKKEQESDHSIVLGAGVNKLNLKFDMLDSEDNNENSSKNISTAHSHITASMKSDVRREALNKDDFKQLKNNYDCKYDGDISIDGVVRGDENNDVFMSPDKRTSGDNSKNKVESPLKNISINLNDNSDVSSSSAQKKILAKKLQQQNLNSALLDRNSSKFLRLSPSGGRKFSDDKENQLFSQIIPSSPSIHSSRKKLKSLPKLPLTNSNSPILNVKMMSPASKVSAHLDLDMSSSINSSKNDSPLRNFNIGDDSQLKNFNRVSKHNLASAGSNKSNMSQYVINQKSELQNLMNIVTNMQKNISVLSNNSSDSKISSPQKFTNLKQKYDIEVASKLRLSTQNKELLQKIVQLEKDLADSHKKITKSEAALLNKNQKEVELEKKYNQLEKAFNDSIKNHEEEISIMKKQKTEMLQKLNKQETSTLEKIKSLAAERDVLLKDITSKKELIVTLNKSVADFNKNNEESLSKLSTELYEQYSKKHEDKLNYLKQSYTQALNSLKKLVHSLRDDLTKKNEEITKLKQQVLSGNQPARRTGYHR